MLMVWRCVSADTPSLGAVFNQVEGTTVLSLSEINQQTFFLSIYCVPGSVPDTGDTGTSHGWALPMELTLS